MANRGWNRRILILIVCALGVGYLVFRGGFRTPRVKPVALHTAPLAATTNLPYSPTRPGWAIGPGRSGNFRIRCARGAGVK